MYKEVAEYTKEGNLWEFLGKNMTFWSESQSILGSGSRAFLADCRLVLDGVVYRTQTIICNFRKHTRFWVKALIISAILFCSAFPTERVDYG